MFGLKIKKLVEKWREWKILGHDLVAALGPIKRRWFFDYEWSS